MRNLIFLILMFVANTSAAQTPDIVSAKGNKNINDFNVAKRVLPRIVRGHEITLYCGCAYENKTIKLETCGIPPFDDPKSRFNKLEWEHVVPAARFGSSLASWRDGDEALCGVNRRGRKCAQKASPLFDQMEGDLYNLYPESGGINGARSNKEPAEVADGKKIRTFGTCETTTGSRTFAPRPNARGDIARTYFYMADAYSIPLSDEEKKKFEAWNVADPVDDWECERARRIKIEQGNANRFVEGPCVARVLSTAPPK